MNQVELGVRQAKLIVLKYRLECVRHHMFELEKEVNTDLQYKSTTKHLYEAKIDILARVEADLKRIIERQVGPFEPDYLHIEETS